MILLALAHSVALSVADGSRIEAGAELRVEWLSGARVVAEQTLPVVDGAVQLGELMKGADVLRVWGPTFISRPVELREGPPSNLTLVRGARVGVSSGAGQGRLYLFAPGRDGMPKTYEVGGVGRSVVVWPASYVAILDAGPARPVRVEEISLLAGTEQELFRATPAPEAVSVPVSVRFEDETGVPLEGVSLVVPPDATPRVRGLLSVLRDRAGCSGRDGKLELGLVPASIGSLRFHLDGRRDTVLRSLGGPLPGPEAVRLVLAPFATLRYRWAGHPKAGQEYGVVVDRCATEAKPEVCREWTAFGRGRFDERGAGALARVPPGWYRLTLRGDGPSLAWVDAELPWDSRDPDPPELAFEPLGWELAGTVVDPDGQPVAGARVRAGAVVRSGIPPAGVVEERSAGDGSFRMTFLSSVREVALAAASEEPPGATEATIVSSSDRKRTDERLVLRPGGVRVRVLERGSDEPLGGCAVTVRGSRSGSSTVGTQLTGKDGTVTFLGTGAGAIVVEVTCEGHAPSAGTAVEASTRVADVPIRLERSGTVSVRVVDRAGRAVAGARVFVADPDGGPDGFRVPVDLAGLAEVDGRLDLPGDRYGSVPVFVLAPGLALGIARLPVPGCAGEDCTIAVPLHPPGSFSGATASSASGKALPPSALVFSWGGIPLPTSLMGEIALLHGLGDSWGVVGAGRGAVNVLPGYLPPGDYEVGYLVGSRQIREVKAVPAGYLHLPSSLPVDFRVHAVP